MKNVTFHLPLGLVLDGKTNREGHMHLATTEDELAIQNSDDVGMNSRYRDIMLLSRVIDDIGGINPVTVRMIEELFEADFLYLQILYKSINGEAETRVKSICPNCKAESVVHLPELYKDMGLFQPSDADGRG